MVQNGSVLMINQSSLKYYRDCVQYTDTLKTTIVNPDSRIDIMANRNIQMRIDDNYHIYVK